MAEEDKKTESYWIQERLKAQEDAANDINAPLVYPVMIRTKDVNSFDKHGKRTLIKKGYYEAYLENGDFVRVAYEDNLLRTLKSITFGNLELQEPKKMRELKIRQFIRAHHLIEPHEFEAIIQTTHKDLLIALKMPSANPTKDLEQDPEVVRIAQERKYSTPVEVYTYVPEEEGEEEPDMN